MQKFIQRDKDLAIKYCIQFNPIILKGYIYINVYVAALIISVKAINLVRP